MNYYKVLPFVVAIVYRAERSEIVVGKHPNLEHKPYPGLWDLPGGKLLPGEDPKVCVQREIMEETGLDIVEVSLFDVFLHDGTAVRDDCRSNIPSLGLCYKVAARGDLKPTEMLEMHWANKDELRSLDLTPWAAYFLRYIY